MVRDNYFLLSIYLDTDSFESSSSYCSFFLQKTQVPFEVTSRI